MDHRTYGETKDCKGCRYWSEMIAQVVGGGPVQALCLAQKPAPLSGKFTTSSHSCDAWASGHFGAIDEPGQDPRVYDEKPCTSCTDVDCNGECFGDDLMGASA